MALVIGRGEPTPRVLLGDRIAGGDQLLARRSEDLEEFGGSAAMPRGGQGVRRPLGRGERLPPACAAIARKRPAQAQATETESAAAPRSRRRGPLGWARSLIDHDVLMTSQASGGISVIAVPCPRMTACRRVEIRPFRLSAR